MFDVREVSRRVFLVILFAAAPFFCRSDVNAFAYDWIPDIPTWDFSETNGSQSGAFLLSGLDLNRDGYDDLVVGFPTLNYETGSTGLYGGSVLVFLGSDGGLPAASNAVIVRNDSPNYAGSLADGGDLDGDGFGDLVLPDSQWPFGHRSSGRVFIHYGTPSGISTAPDKTIAGETDVYDIGGAWASNLDMNGDGYSDLFFSYREANATPSEIDDTAGVRGFYGSVNGIGDVPDWSIVVPDCAPVGLKMEAAGDVNGDGFGDIIVFCTYGSEFVRVYYGSAQGPGASPNLEVASDDPHVFDWLGIRRAGDINGDQVDDLISTNPYDEISRVKPLFLFFGSPDGISKVPSTTLEIQEPTGEYISNVTFAFFSRCNDVNHDGFGDVIFNVDHAFVALLHGKGDGLENEYSWIINDFDLSLYTIGVSSTFSDTNGDGRCDVFLSGFETNKYEFYNRVLGFYGSGTLDSTTTTSTTTTTTTIPTNDDPADDDDASADDDSGIPLDDDAGDAADGEEDDEEGCCGC
ncbi:hypothetical protein K8I61_08465 [bacterium]|nr:hypothetical protein [bacterium]